MKKTMRQSVVLGALMVGAAISAQALIPTAMLSAERPALTLERAIPAQFGDWHQEMYESGAIVNPETSALLKKIYSQTLSRTYVNRNGDRVMLSIAYGGDQRDGVQLHYPEVCYPAQGFELRSSALGTLATPGGVLPVKRLITNLAGTRNEPVTYWTTVGDIVVTGGIDKKMAEMRYGLRGKVPDGLLFRMSTVTRDESGAFALHEDFARQLQQALPPETRARFFGVQP